MRPAFDDPPVAHHDDAFRRADRREAVGDYERGARRHQAFKRLLDKPLALGIERTGRLIEQQDWRIAQ